MPHVIVVGAGPAGSMAAWVLAGRGWQVSILEQQRFPRDKVCGEMLSALGVDVLRRHRLWPLMLPHGPASVTRAILHAPRGQEVSIPLPRPIWGVSRRVLDMAMLSAVRDVARAYQPVRCERVIGGIMPCVTVRNLIDNSVQDLCADCVIVANGCSGIWGYRPAATGDLGLKAHYRAVDGPRDAVELFSVRGHYVGLGPIEDNQWNLAMSVPVQRVRGLNGNHQRLLDQLVLENKGLARRLDGATQTSDWLVCPLPRYSVRDSWPTGVVPVGNAAAALEPIGGEGMGLALASAELAAETIDAAVRSTRPLDVTALRRRYLWLWTKRRATCRAAAMCVSSPALAQMAVRTLSASQTVGDAVLALLGKAGVAVASRSGAL